MCRFKFLDYRYSSIFFFLEYSTTNTVKTRVCGREIAFREERCRAEESGEILFLSSLSNFEHICIFQHLFLQQLNKWSELDR